MYWNLVVLRLFHLLFLFLNFKSFLALRAVGRRITKIADGAESKGDVIKIDNAHASYECALKCEMKNIEKWAWVKSDDIAGSKNGCYCILSDEENVVEDAGDVDESKGLFYDNNQVIFPFNIVCFHYFTRPS